MAKNIFLNIAAVSLSSVLLTSNLHATSREGIYVGAGIGGTFDNFDLSSRNTLTGFTIDSPNQSNSSWLGSVFGGFGTTFDNGFYLGGELGTYFPRRSATVTGRPGVTITSTTYSNTMRVQDYVTLDALPGFRLNEDWLLYGRLGLTYANLKMYQSPTAVSIPFNAEENRIGGRIGAGVNFSLDSHFSVGLDYFYTHYPDMTSNFTTYNIQFNQKTSSNYVGVSAIYTM